MGKERVRVRRRGRGRGEMMEWKNPKGRKTEQKEERIWRNGTKNSGREMETKK